MRKSDILYGSWICIVRCPLQVWRVRYRRQPAIYITFGFNYLLSNIWFRGDAKSVCDLWHAACLRWSDCDSWTLLSNTTAPALWRFEVKMQRNIKVLCLC